VGKQKYYAVRNGRVIGIYDNWEKCKEQIHGWKGAEYKSFSSKESALSWLNYECEPEQADIITERREKQESLPGFTFSSGEKPVTIYTIHTDGSCLKNPGGPGGWAAVVTEKGTSRLELSGGEPETTNNRMELTAAIKAIEHTSFPSEIYLYTDSQYLKNALTKNWLQRWKRNGWKTADGGEVKNQDLWRELDRVMEKRTIHFNWIPGHAGNPENEKCDQLAKKAAHSQRTA